MLDNFVEKILKRLLQEAKSGEKLKNSVQNIVDGLSSFVYNNILRIL